MRIISKIQMLLLYKKMYMGNNPSGATKIEAVKNGLGVSQSLCKPPNRCKIRLLSLEVLLWQEKTKAHKKQQ